MFQDVAGIGGYGVEKSYAKTQSIRREVFQENNDRIGQLMGLVIGKVKANIINVDAILYLTRFYPLSYFRYVYEHVIHIFTIQ